MGVRIIAVAGVGGGRGLGSGVPVARAPTGVLVAMVNVVEAAWWAVPAVTVCPPRPSVGT